MLPTNVYEQRFKKSSETGTQVFWLKSKGVCDCFDSDNLINSEPDPRCLKCFGTGNTRNVILTSKIRNEIQNKRAESFEDTMKNSTINERRKFYVPEIYKEMSTTDLIVFLDSDLTPISLYKIINKEQFKAEDFIFYEITGEKINFIPELTKYLREFEQLQFISDEQAGQKELAVNIT